MPKLQMNLFLKILEDGTPCVTQTWNTSAWLRKWCPVDTKIVDVEFELCGNFLTLIANVNIATDASIVDAAKQMLSFRKSTGDD